MFRPSGCTNAMGGPVALHGVPLQTTTRANVGLPATITSPLSIELSFSFAAGHDLRVDADLGLKPWSSSPRRKLTPDRSLA